MEAPWLWRPLVVEAPGCGGPLVVEAPWLWRPLGNCSVPSPKSGPDHEVAAGVSSPTHLSGPLPYV